MENKDLLKHELELLSEAEDAVLEALRSARRKNEFANLPRMDARGNVTLPEPKPIDFENTFKSVDRLVKVSESRRKLLGLDQPTRTDLTVTEQTAHEAELEEMLRELDARKAHDAAVGGPDSASGGFKPGVTSP